MEDFRKNNVEQLNKLLRAYEKAKQELFKARKEYVDIYMPTFYERFNILSQEQQNAITDSLSSIFEKKINEYDDEFFLDSRMIELKLMKTKQDEILKKV